MRPVTLFVRTLFITVSITAAACDRGETTSSTPAPAAVPTAPPTAAPGVTSPQGADATAAPVQSQGGFAYGKVLGEDGKPIAIADDISISLYGVSEAGEKVNYSPAVKPDGSYRQKLVPGSYRFGIYTTVKVKRGAETFTFFLEPKGSMWNKDREAKDGIEQDFVWKVTGQRPGTNGDLNNHTNWYGMNIGFRFNTWRNDTNKAPPTPPDGTKLIVTLKPLSKCIDGRDLQPITVERAWRANDITQNDDLNDLPPADYEVTGVAKLPDGTTKPILMMGKGDYPNFKPTVRAPLEKDNISGGLWAPPLGWVIE